MAPEVASPFSQGQPVRCGNEVNRDCMNRFLKGDGSPWEQALVPQLALEFDNSRFLAVSA